MNWRKEKLGNILSYEQPTKYIVNSDQYNDSFLTPVLTAGKSFVLGHTNERSGIYSNLPVIIFDDFTTEAKYVDFPFKVKSSAMKILTTDSKMANLRFMFYLLSTLNVESEQHKRYWISKFSELEVAVPPLDIQNNIAYILDKADALRKNDRQLLQYYDLLSQSLFIELFGDPIKNEKGWELKRLGDVFSSFKYGTNEKSNEFKPNSIPVLRIPNIIGNTISLNDIKYSILNFKEAENTKLKKGDLLFVRTNGNPNYIGRSAVYNIQGDYSYASYLIRARMNAENYPFSLYIQYAMAHQSYRPIILKKATTTAGNYNINTESLKSLLIQCPDVSHLHQFARQIQNIDQQKEILKAQIQESQNLFQALLQRAFNGSLN